MKKYKNIVLATFGMVTLAGCSAWPDQAEAPMAAAEPAPMAQPAPKMAKVVEPPVTAADAASAIMAADMAISNAKQRNNLWRDTTRILAKADDAMGVDDYKGARNLADRARSQAEAALDQAYRSDALYLMTQLRENYFDKMRTGQKMRLASASRAYDDGRVQVAYDAAAEIMDELKPKTVPVVAEVVEEVAPVPVSAPEPVVVKKSMPAPVQASASTSGSYTVNSSDNLWSIAAKSEVYGNADMWPLLWKLNQEKIKRPDDLATGMVLMIDRNASEKSIAAAIKHSKLRGATSLGPVDAFDQQYLSR